MSHLASLLESLHTTYPTCGCISTEPASKWDFGTVVGNGSQGALAFSRPYNEEIVFSHEELFLPLFPDRGYLPVKEHYATIQRLVLEGKANEAQDLIRDLKVDGGFPHYNTTDPFVGASALDIRVQDGGEPNDYVRSVNFESGEALVAWSDEHNVFHRRFFASRAHDIIALEISSPTGSKVSVSLRLREIAYKAPEGPKDRNVYELTIADSQSTVSETVLTHRMVYKKRLDPQPINGCCTVARVDTTGGDIAVSDGYLHITDADRVMLIALTVPDRRGETLSVDTLTTSLTAIDMNYDALLEAHAAIQREMFNRCTLTLSGPDEQLVTSEDLQAGSEVGATSPALVEKVFGGARYGIIGSTGNLPPALQGVWTGTWTPCWSGDYTLNGNVQSMVAASLCSNHYECLESLMDYLDSLMDDFRRNADELLGFRGPLIPWRSSTHGRTHYLAYKQYHHDYPGVYWFAGAAWSAQHYYDYYLYTGDTEFLQHRLKPLLLECVAFYEDYLTLEQDGVFVLSPSSSPENETANNVWMAPNATMTIAAVKQLLRTLLTLADKLDASESDVTKWKTMLSKMPPYVIGKNGALKEWTWPGIENKEKHRHASHLYPLYFGIDPEIAASDSLKEACRVAIEKRMAPRRPDKGGFMAFGFTQLGLAAAHLGDTALAYESVEYLVNSYWSPVMISQHNRYEHPDVLNMDISGGLPALIITMLVQSDGPLDADTPWSIKLLPCLPEAWPEGALKGARCRGGFELDIAWQNGALTNVTVKSLRGASCEITYKEHNVVLELDAGKACSLTGHLERTTS